MNILFLPSWYETEDEPNSGSFFVEQAKALQSIENNVTIAIVDIINFPYKCSAKKFKIIEEHRHNIDVYRIKVPSFMTGQMPDIFFNYYTFFYIKLYKYMIKKGMHFDIMYAHSFWHAGYIGAILKKKYNIPLVVQEHRSMLITGELKKSVNKFLKKTVLESDVFYCVSNRLRNNVYDRIGISSGIKLLPNMVDDIFKYYDLKNDKFVFSFIGTLNENKRVLQLLKCFKKFCLQNENAVLNIAGDGSLRSELEQYIQSSSNFQARVNLLGFLSRDAVVDLLKETNVFVLPSAFETFGVVYIEAMAVGRPVIATRNGGANDIVNESNGILIEVDNDEQLCNAMKFMYENYSAYNLKKISADCKNLYSQTVVMNRVLCDMKRILRDYE